MVRLIGRTPRPIALFGIVSILLLANPGAGSAHRSRVPAQTPLAQSASPMRGFAESLDLIRDLLQRGRGIEAENVARALLPRVESVRGPDALEVAEVLDLLYQAVRRSPKISNEEKKAIVERAVAIKERTLAPSDPELATSLIYLGVQRALEGDPAAGRPLLERALGIREAAFGPDHVLVAVVLQNLAGLLMTLDDDARAVALAERAQRVRERAYGAEHPEAVRTLLSLAVLYQETGDYTAARQRYARALDLCERARHPVDLATLNLLTGLALALSDLGGDFAGSARLTERLLALTEQLYGPMDPRLRTPLERLAMDFRDLGDYEHARPVAERSLAIAERAFGPTHAEVASSLHTLATILAGLGDYSGAMQLFERATRINEKVLRPSDPETARASWFIHDLFPLSGYGPDEVDLFERVVAVRENECGLCYPRTAESLSNLAATLSRAEDFKRTRPLFERALQAQEQFLGPDHPEVAAAVTNLATVLSGAGEIETAGPLYERALRIWETSLGADHPKVATALVNLARVHLNSDDYQAAGPLLARALAIQEKALGPDHPGVAVTLGSSAELAARTGATTDAFAMAARADAISRENLRLTIRTLSERQALAYSASLPSSIDLMVRLASTRPSDGEMSTAAWNAVIRARGLVLDEMAARHRSVSADQSGDAAKLVEALATARQRLAALSVRGVRNDPPERYRRSLELARAEKERAERALAENSARFREDLRRSGMDVSDVSAALGSGSALVGYVRYQGDEPSYVAFVLRGGAGVPAIVPLGKAAPIEALVLQWRRQLDQEAMAPGRNSMRGEAAYRRVARQLRHAIWDPLLTYTSDARRIFIVPDGSLHLVSFAALPTGESTYLVERGPLIHFLSSERDIVPGQARELTGEGLLALGGPAFDESGRVRAAAEASFRGTRSACGDFQSMRFDPLPASLKEVDRVVTLWERAHGITTDAAQLRAANPSTRDVVRLTGTAATESAFKVEAANHRVLHLATHGFFLDARCPPPLDSTGSSMPVSMKLARENPLLLSGLVLAGANQRDRAAPDEEDGVLTAEEVAALNLEGVEWAVLSGCDTGVGEVRAGEGVFGLRRAFQIAGASTLIMSLWSVEDDATRVWMTALYEGRFMKKLSTAEAVHQASLAVLRQRRVKGVSTHPFYWAGFVAAGDWR